MKKLKQALSLSLALVLSLAMAVPAFAAGTTETVVDEKHGVTITMNGFLRKETHTYMCCAWSDGVNDYVLVPTEMTIYVLADGSTVNVEASNGFKYTQFEEWSEEWSNLNEETDFDNCDYAWTKDTYIAWDSESKAFDPIYNENRVLTGTKIYEITATPADETLYVKDFYSICWVGESDFAKLVPVDGQPTTPTEPTAPPQPEQPTTPTEPDTPTQPTQPEQPTTPTTPVVPGNPGSYTVKKGDTWSSICTNFYGTNAQRYALMNANKNVKLKEGAVITLPEKLGKDTLIPAPVVAAGEKLYTVKAGDTLGKIAAAEYGKVSEYKAIFERNTDRLKNANTIYEGQVIVLPVKK